MSKLFLVLAVLCFASMVSADMVQLSLFDHNDCSGSSYYTLNYTIGECKNNQAYYVSGTTIWAINFGSDSGCNAGNATYASGNTAGACYNGRVYSNIGSTPAAPVDVSSWASSTTHYNATSGRVSKDCSGTVLSIFAGAPVACAKLGGAFYTNGGCSGSGTYNTWQITYSDAACSTQVSFSQSNGIYGTCDQGTTTSACTGSQPGISSALTLSAEQGDYDSSCTFNSTTTTKTWISSGVCVGGHGGSFSGSCAAAANGTSTQNFNVNSYQSTDCSGTAYTTTYVDGVCTAGDRPNNWSKFKCVDSPSSASAATVSTLVMMVAALLALVSVRSL